MNAAGTCRTLEEVQKLLRSASAAVMVGSITIEPRAGNSGNVYRSGKTYSLNSLGLPNGGLLYYREETLLKMVSCAYTAGKPLFVSIAGFSPDEYAVLSSFAFACGADLVELNLGCPNVWDGSTQKQIPCFDPALVCSILSCVETKVGANAKISVKISPFSDPYMLSKVVKVIGMSKVVKAVTAVNTFPNAFGYEREGGKLKPQIGSGNGLAGLGGPVMKSIGLGHIRQLKDLLPSRIQIIGVGGITRGTDVLEYLDSGACVTQVATAYLEQREGVFSSLLTEMAGSMDD